jgi:undecaprenyl-diphosphatase
MQLTEPLPVEPFSSVRELAHKQRWIGWLVAGAALPAAGLLDSWTANQFTGHGPTTSGQINTVIQSMRCWGDGATLVVVSLGLALVQPHRWRELGGMLAVALLCAGLVDLVKPVVGRQRPSDAEPAQSAWGIPWHTGNGRNSSFPSGHTATAFSFARGLSLIHPALRGLGIGAASGTALSRMADRRHYLSDCVAGALLGWFLTQFLLTRIFSCLARANIVASQKQPQPAEPRAIPRLF